MLLHDRDKERKKHVSSVQHGPKRALLTDVLAYW